MAATHGKHTSSIPVTISRSQSDFLNFARWVAAWLVVAEHTRSLLFRDFADAGARGLLSKAFYFVTAFGHEAVMIFFVISGYLVGGKVWEEFRQDRFEWRSYLCDRVSRLHAVLLAALVCGWLIDSIGAQWFGSSGLYTNQTAEPVAVVGRSFIEALDLPTLAGNLCFLQTIMVAPFGSNGPLWSLANEWWYYLSFPAILGSVRAGGLRRRVVSFTAVLALMWFLPGPMWALFGVWLLGVVAAVAPRVPAPWWITAPVCLVSLTVVRLELLPGGLLGNYLIGVTFAFLLSSLGGREGRAPFAEVSRHLADFSYSTYLLHFPLVVFAAAALQHLTESPLRMKFGGGSLVIYIAVVVAVISASWGLSCVTEARTPGFRGWLRRVFRVSPNRSGHRAVSVAPLIPDP